MEWSKRGSFAFGRWSERVDWRSRGDGAGGFAESGFGRRSIEAFLLFVASKGFDLDCQGFRSRRCLLVDCFEGDTLVIESSIEVLGVLQRGGSRSIDQYSGKKERENNRIDSPLLSKPCSTLSPLASIPHPSVSISRARLELRPPGCPPTLARFPTHGPSRKSS